LSTTSTTEPEPNERRDSRFLPTEGNLCSLFSGADDELVTRIFSAMERYTCFSYPDERFDLVRPEHVPSFLASPVASLHFLEFLVALLRPMRILELGTNTGLSALYMASTLPPGGEIVTLERYPIFADTARRNFAANGKADVIRCIVGDAWETLAGLEAEAVLFDLIFLDANKERYDQYFPRLAALLRVGGLFIVDDAFAQGDVLNDTPATEKGAGVLRFLEATRHAENWQRFLLPFFDGSLFMCKLSE
jgi:predicted O-methyltransferase YrrM